MAPDTLLLTVFGSVTSLGSIGTLAVAVRLGMHYGKDKQLLDGALVSLSEVRGDVKTILGNGHPGPFVPREVFDGVDEEIGRQRATLNAHTNILQQHEIRLVHIERNG